MRFNPPSRKTAGETASLLAFRGLPLAALIAILAVILYYSFAFFMHASIADAKRVGQASPPAQLSSDDVSRLKKEALDAELVEKLKEDVKRYLEWVMAIAGVFAVAQTLAAGFTAQAFTDQAEKAIGRAEAQLDRAQTELERFKQKYEGLVVAEEKRTEALDELKRRYIGLQPVDDRPAATPANRDALAEGLDWRDDLYGSMKIEDRQRLLSIERYLGFDLKLKPSDISTPYTLRVLANFYVSKFEYEKRFASAHIGDLERADYLLQLWIQLRPSQFEIRNDLGLVYGRLSKYFEDLVTATGVSGEEKAAAVELGQKYRTDAYQQFDLSRQNEPNQQRAYYNLAIIEKEYRNNLPVAIQFLEKARKITAWEHRENKTMLGNLLYNFACYRALQTVADKALGDAGKVDEVVSLIEEVASKAYTPEAQVVADFDNDGVNRTPKGDFYDFLQGLAKEGDEGRKAIERMNAARPSLSTRK